MENCVKDCDPESKLSLLSDSIIALSYLTSECHFLLITSLGGDRSCGGIVKEAWVVLHDTPEDCCTHEYDWIDNDLCAARSTLSPLNKYWADKTNAKCEDDSVNPTTDLSAAIYNSIESCCSEGLSWLTEAECLSASGMDSTGLGTNKYYVDFASEQCSQDCEGPAPCGGLTKQWNILYSTADECCEQIWWIAKKDCVKE